MNKQELINIIKQIVDIDDVVIEIPKEKSLGDYAMPCFNLSKKLHQNPNEIANSIKQKIDETLFEKVEVKNAYINFFLKREEVTKQIINEILEKGEKYGSSEIGKDKTVVVEYSSPNVAKPFGIGHLRSTVIGNALKNIYQKLGYKTVSINYLGDCGTQFGKLIYAYETWGEEQEVKKNPIKELSKLYVRFHEEAKNNPSLDEEGRKIFKALEDGNEHYLKLWQWFSDESIKEFMKTYNLLKINDFDVWTGESHYIEKAKDVLKELEDKGLLEMSEGATIISLDDLPPALVKRTDGATLYITRDIAAILDRMATYDFEEILYVVGNEQTLHFNQLKEVIKKMGYDFYNDIYHIPFGLVLTGGKKMSTRAGSAANLQDILEKAVSLAEKRVSTHVTENVCDVSRMVGVGAVIFNDLKNYRTNDIDFNLEDILKFEGETGPYLQYTYARINSLLSHKINTVINYKEIEINDYIWNIVFKLSDYPNIIIKAKENNDPSMIAKYLLELANMFNKFYANNKIITEDKENTAFKLQISQIVSIVLKNGLNLLGIETPYEM